MRRAFIISYDLSNPGRNYVELLKRIKSSYAWARLGGSAYIIITDSSAVEIRDYLQLALDRNDEVSNWLRNNLN